MPMDELLARQMPHSLEAEQAESRIGLLSLSDFFAGNPNYEEIACTMPMAL